MSGRWSAEALLAPWLVDAGLIGRPVQGVCLDSREARPDGLFLAIAGDRSHGLDYVDEALARGVRTVLYEPAQGRDEGAIRRRCQQAGAVAIPCAGLSGRASAIAGRFHGEPSQSMRVIGVTGTDGKTSVAHYIAQLMGTLGQRAAMMGTIGWGPPDQLMPSSRTTADAVSVQARLAELRDSGVQCVAMEVSSHALSQHRVDAVAFDRAVLTQVGRDHLDYHGSAEAYRAAKRRLFAWPTLTRQVLNRDDAVGADLADRPLSDARRLTYSRHDPADLRLRDAERGPAGLRLTLEYRGRRETAVLPLIGRFNALNALAALGAVIEPDQADALLTALTELRPVPGRMERFAAAGEPLIVVDYAHTPGALTAALEALRPHVTGRLWLVFGCGGDRDPGKRPLMGAAAAGQADVLILTNDNPRSEAPRAIIDAVRTGCRGHGDCRVIEDRAAAILAAIDQAAPEDGVLIAGKGHETEQVIGDRVQAFSDRETVAERLSRRAG